MKDDNLDRAVRLAIDTSYISVSLIQRRLNLGYTSARGLIDDMEHLDVIGPPRENSNLRDVLIDLSQWEGMNPKEQP